ncbi:MAG: carboxypeptidase regulatory-like domain-containing protein [Clostridia bacterium]|nr:carboxypeptidase regulatory-like domain-containing protein [Clostridia bacterium]
MRKVVLFLFLMLVLTCGFGMAEERQIGDYIYVPAGGTRQVTDVVHMTVEGVGYSAETGEPRTEANLSGAEFGVYVINAEGEVRPWANPLYPMEQMKIRTGAEGASFTLPSGMDYYLKQESTQSGYLFDADELIPVVGTEIRVQNVMPSLLAVSACDSLNTPIPGIEITLTGEDGSQIRERTDETGWVRFYSDTGFNGTVAESELTSDAFPARSVTINGVKAETVAVAAKPGECTLIRFEHPATGTVQLNATLTALGDSGEPFSQPLAGVTMTIEADPQVTLVTDETGYAEASLLEGTYPVTFSSPDAAIQLPFTEASLEIGSGGFTGVPVEAFVNEGRIVLEADFGGQEARGTVTILSETDGTVAATLDLPKDGHLVSPSLAAGNYWVQLVTGEQTRISTLTSEQMTEQDEEAICLEVLPGKLSLLEAKIAVPRKQLYSLAFRFLTELGETEVDDLRLDGEGTLLSEDGTEEEKVEIENGELTAETFSGTYILEIDAETAKAAGIRRQSEAFELPSQDGTILFPAAGGRVLLSATDAKGNPVASGMYRITDAEGTESVVTTDENGLAISAVLAGGPADIESVQVPEGFEAVQGQVQVEDGALALAELVQPRQGVLTLRVMRQSVEKGQIVLSPMAGAAVTITAVTGQVPAGTDLRSDEDGIVRLPLAVGEYEAALTGALPAGEKAGDSVHVTMQNDTETGAELVCFAAEGGIEVMAQSQGKVDPMLLTQMQFELRGEGDPVLLRLEEGTFRAEGLPEGNYTLAETQAPAGYPLIREREVEIRGGQIAGVTIPLVEYATVRVAKYGLTFDDQMKNYLVPLKGRYGVFVKAGSELVPYPDAEHQIEVYSNVSADSELPSVAQLPAEEEGSVFYLMELDASEGFGKDTEQHEITVRPGDAAEVTGSVSSDRGFYHVTLTDAETGEAVSGAWFTLADADGNVLDTFELDGQYRNEMAIPVGDYVLTQTRAADGYLLTDVQQDFQVLPYLSMGGQVTELAFTTMRIPGENWEQRLFHSMEGSAGQGFTLLTVDPAAVPVAIGLTMPQLTLRLADNSGSAGIRTVSLTGAENGTPGADIRVEYAAAGCGWLMSRSQIVRAAELPKNVVFPDEEAVYAVRLTYLDPETGLEQCPAGFVPGDVVFQIENYQEQPVQVSAEAAFTGTLSYRTEAEQPMQQLAIRSHMATEFAAVPSGIHPPVVMGRDGQISGMVFYDRNADGIALPDEQGMPSVAVTLCDLNGNEIKQTLTDEQGRYVFSALSAGQYTLNFDEGRLYTHGQRYSAYLCSNISLSGISEPITIDNEHTDEWILAGAVYPAGIQGQVSEQISRDQTEPVEGWAIDLFHEGLEEPITIWTTDSGSFQNERLLPGDYDLCIQLPANTLSREAEDGKVVKQISVSEGEMLDIPDIVFMRGATVQGAVHVDEDGDGQVPENAQAVSGIHVELSEIQTDGHTEPVANAVTDAQGQYRFDGLAEGNYLVSFQLDDPWVFTQFGTGSDVFGSVSANGSTQAFQVDCGSVNVRNAGVTLPSQFTVTVFSDTKMNGIRSADEPGLANVRISLVRIEGDSDGETVSAYTDENGAAVFERVSPGRYAVSYQMPGIWRTTVMPQPAENQIGSFVPQSTEPEGRSGTFEIPMGSALELAIGAIQTVEISGRAYYDDNADATLSEGEAGAGGVVVTLLNSDGAAVQQTTTGPDGAYAFAGLPQGRYFVQFQARDGECFSGSERTANRGAAERSDESVSRTRVIILEEGRSMSTADAGIIRPSRISGSLYIDRNANTVRDAEEQPLSGAKVSLTNASGRTLISTAETDAEGNFVLERVVPGHYKLRIDPGEEYVYSGSPAGNALPIENQSGSWVYTSEFVIYGNTTVENLSYGFLSQGVIAGLVWEDKAYNGQYPDGNGLRYVTVNLIGEDGQTCGSVKTDREGRFRFEKLRPGRYTLEVTLESGYVFTVDGKDSAAPRMNAETCVLTLDPLEMGEVRDDVMIGALKPGSVSGYAWYDADNDGRRQPDSTPMAEVLVKLRMISGSDSGVVRETVTDANGYYRFDTVMPGNFILEATLPEEMAFAQNRDGQKRVSNIPQTDENTGESGAMTMTAGLNLQEVDIGAVGIGTISGRAWTDAVYDGNPGKGDAMLAGVNVILQNAATGEIVRQAVTGEDGTYQLERLRTGDYRIEFELPANMIFTTNGSSVLAMLDTSSGMTEPFHFDMGGNLSGMDVGAIVPVTIDGVVSDEDLGQGCSGVMVSLMEGGMALKTAQTDLNGVYHFDTIRPGSYRLRFSIDEKHLFALNVPLSLTGADAREGETETVNLPMGQAVRVNPIQLVRCAQIDGSTWLDVNVDGHLDTGENALSGIHLTLMEAGTKAVVAEADSDEKGRFTLMNLRKGTYILAAELPEGMLFTDYTGREMDSCMEPTENNRSESQPFALSSGETVTMNIGGILPGVIGDTVWVDLNANGLQDYMEPQRSQVGITLLLVSEDGTETEIASVSSDLYGYYHFEGLRPGRYRIRVNGEQMFTAHYGEPLQEIDSDILPETGMSEIFLLQSGERKLNVDIGILAR